jgi:GMP synthase-like glutamine amidotransferase
MHILVLQHARVEHPGIFRTLLDEDGHTWEVVELDEGQALPDIEGFDALWVMGGPMDVWEEDKYPWLKHEKKYINHAVSEKGIPFLGLCLGHQLLAEALGGEVGKSEVPEIGVLDVQLTEKGATGVFLDDIPSIFPCLQWHSAEIKRLPEGAQVLATSPDCAVQAMSWGPRAYSLQFHVEIGPETVRNWAQISEYASALGSAMGQGGAAKLEAQCSAKMEAFNKMAERLYMNWLQTSAKA